MPTSARILFSLCLSCLSTWASASTPSPDACRLASMAPENFVMRIPFEVVDGRIYVQARVNDRGPFRFAIDTGASGLGRADASLVSTLNLKPQGKAEASDGVQAAQVDTVHLDALELGGLSRKGLDVITRNYSGRMPAGAAFHGIVGREFFADGLLILDYPNKTLAFSRTLSLPAAGEHILKYERAFRVPVSIGSIRTEGNLDTGANVSFVMPQALYDKVGKGPLELAGQGTLTNTRIDTMRAVVPGPFRIGAASIKDVEVRVSERFPELLVGAHVLRNYTVMIDQRSRSIALCP
ncbi:MULTISPECIES: aspartyl protease family protein [unclassified Massilia]|uniref:aspartyl protease family protein n=1 Tax=unclassified Massilia TaxID=2609279 RepID=UPI001B829F5E|nr:MULTISPECIES: aspartyl protease family protein [unclassified Massilia]MBQ5940210.1 aspartyl protease family protein [Massilia sp. AB1]MBQ5962794.1 aspartyl protease family protein [Massilia sp. ZL223]